MKMAIVHKKTDGEAIMLSIVAHGATSSAVLLANTPCFTGKSPSNVLILVMDVIATYLFEFK